MTQSGINALEQGHTFDAMHLFAQSVVTNASDTRAQADNRLRLSFLGIGHAPALRLILEHADLVTSAAFSPDGARVVTSSDDKTARIWSASDGTLIAELRGHEGKVNSATFSPDGTQVVTTSADQTARVWNVADGKLMAELKGHKGWVTSAAFSPDGTRIVTTSWIEPERGSNAVIRNEPARVWKVADGTLIGELKGHEGGVTSAAFSPDGTRVVTASHDKTARVWNAANGKQIAKLSGHAGVVTSAAFSPDGTRVVTASYDGTARVWLLEPLKAESETLPVWVQAYTGTELLAGAIRPVSDAEWNARCCELRAYGAKAPPSPWLDGLNLERPAQLGAGRRPHIAPPHP